VLAFEEGRGVQERDQIETVGVMVDVAALEGEQTGPRRCGTRRSWRARRSGVEAASRSSRREADVSGSRRFMARWRFSSGMGLSREKAAAWARACTPASVRPEPRREWGGPRFRRGRPGACLNGGEAAEPASVVLGSVVGEVILMRRIRQRRGRSPAWSPGCLAGRAGIDPADR